MSHARSALAPAICWEDVGDAKRAALEEASAIADEWVTAVRLTRALDKLGNPTDLCKTGAVIAAMVKDVRREATGETVESPAVKKAIGQKAALLFKKRVTALPTE